MLRSLKILLAVLMLSQLCRAAAVKLNENDLDRIVYLTEPFGDFPKGSFFVFREYDEHDRPVFVPLSGANKQYIISMYRMEKTDYFSHTEPYEIALDAYRRFYVDDKKYGEVSFSRSLSLLEILGKAQLLKPMMEVLAEQRKFNEALAALRREYQTKADEIAKERSAKRGSTSPKGNCRQGVCPFSAVKSADQDEEDKQAELEQLEDLLEKEKVKLEKHILNINKQIDRQLQSGDQIAAICIYLNMTDFYRKRIRSLTFIMDGKDLFEEQRQELYQQLENSGKAILQKLNERYENFKLAEEYSQCYPNVRGLWRESPPQSCGDLRRFVEHFYQIRRESERYSPLTDFENWGLCRLALLLCIGDNQEEAKYLRVEYTREFRRNRSCNR